MNTAPSVAIIIPCWNAEKFVATAIESALNQTWSAVEVIVVNDGSTDGSAAIIQTYADSIRYLTGPNRGACSARNTGMNQSTSNFLLFLDADDYLTPDAIENWIARATDGDLVLGPFARERDGTRSGGRGPTEPVNSTSLLVDWQTGNFTPPCSVLWRKSFLLEIGGWAEELARNQDGELIVRAILKGARVRTATNGLGIYVQHAGPLRVSARSGRGAVESELRAFQNLAFLAKACDQEIRKAVGRFLYAIACRAYAEDLLDLGDVALKESRILGFNRHIGNTRHVVIAELLGLRRKSLLAMRYRRVLGFLGKTGVRGKLR